MELAIPLPPRAAAGPPPVRLDDATDSDLLGRIATRDAAAFELLYHRYARPVYGLALRMLGDRGRAEDAVQETFTSIWRSASRYRPERGPGAPWLYAIARNAIVDRARARSRAEGVLPPAAPPLHLDRTRGCPDARGVRRRLVRRRQRRRVPRRVHAADARHGAGAEGARDDPRRLRGLGRKLADALQRLRPRPAAPRRLLRAVPLAARQADRDLRHLHRARRDDG